MTVDGVVCRLVTFANLSVLEFALLKILITSSGSACKLIMSGWNVRKEDHFDSVMVMYDFLVLL